MNAADARIFFHVAETLSFKHAAERLSMSRSAVSKRVAQLERELGTALINRTPRSISLTEAGKTLREHCRDIERAVEAAEDAVKDQDREPIGVVLLSMPTSFGAALMPMLMTDFERRYPQVTLSAHFSEPFVDVVSGGYDVVFRVAQKLTDSSLVAQRLSVSPKVLVAAPAYLDAHGTPVHVRELKKHRCLGLGYGSENRTQWRFSGPAGPIDVPIRYAFTANNDLGLNLAACLGAGFLYTAEVLVSSELARGRLKVVLPEFCQGLEYGVFAIYPQKRPPAKVRVLIGFVKQRLPTLHEHDRWAPLNYESGRR
jgi:DNA-binding transcriptional LysR family regulator